MKEVFVCGLGAVSPAGWGVGAMRTALHGQIPLPVRPLAGPGGKSYATRPVPPPATRPGFLSHQRFRRASSITHHLAGAVMEAMTGIRGGLEPGTRLGLIGCFQGGCVQYSCRFFEETLTDPLTASPLVFPETVFAAPTSHIAALLGGPALACTLVGDPSSFLQGLALAASWLEEGQVEVCVVAGAEEYHWLTAKALWFFEHSAIYSSGAGAICLTTNPARAMKVALGTITDEHPFSSHAGRFKAARTMRGQLEHGSVNELLCDGLRGSRSLDGAEVAAWTDWPGFRLSPKRVLGEGLMAAAAWQCVAACDAVVGGLHPAAMVSLVGCNHQAIGARFVGRSREIVSRSQLAS